MTSSVMSKTEARKEAEIGVNNHRAIVEGNGYNSKKGNHILILSIAGTVMCLFNGFRGNNGIVGTSKRAMRVLGALSVTFCGLFVTFSRSNKTGRKHKKARKPFGVNVSIFVELWIEWKKATQQILTDTQAMGEEPHQWLVRQKDVDLKELLLSLPILAKPYPSPRWVNGVDTAQMIAHEKALSIQKGITDIDSVDELVSLFEEMDAEVWDDDWTYSVGAGSSATTGVTDF